MLIPVRCFTCGNVIAHKYKRYREIVESGESPDKALTELGLTRFCCRRMLLSHVDFIDRMLAYTRQDAVG